VAQPPLSCNALATDADIDEDQGEQGIMDDWATTIAATPKDNDGEETNLLTHLNTYLSENLINIEYPNDP
jgi:hypothetical protein